MSKVTGTRTAAARTVATTPKPKAKAAPRQAQAASTGWKPGTAKATGRKPAAAPEPRRGAVAGSETGGRGAVAGSETGGRTTTPAPRFDSYSVRGGE